MWGHRVGGLCVYDVLKPFFVHLQVVESRQRDAETSDASAILVSTLTLVDLAGVQLAA